MSALPPCCASVALFVFVGFSDDRRLALVIRFGVAVFVFVIILLGSRGGIVLPMLVTRLQSTVEKFSGMRWVLSAPCWMSRQSCADVTMRARGQQKVDATRRHGGGSQRKMTRTRAAPDNARTAARQCRIIIGNLAGQRYDLD